MNTIILDVECYHNFFITGCYHVENKVFQCFTEKDLGKFEKYLNRFDPLIISFNGLHYDMRMLRMGFEYKDDPTVLTKLKKFSDFIITAEPGDPRKPFYNQFWWNGEKHWDLKAILGGRLVPSLKKLSYRFHFEELESLPIEPDAILTEEQKEQIIAYNKVDLKNTERLYEYCQPLLELRKSLTENYEINCMSLSDSQIAERVIAADAPRQTAFDPKPQRGMEEFVKEDFHFDLKQLQNFYERLKSLKVQFVQTFDPIKLKPHFSRHYIDPTIEAKPKVDTEVKKKSKEPQREFKSIVIPDVCPSVEFASGGLHSIHKDIQMGEDAYDVDAASYYPNLILRFNIFPKGLGQRFLTKYRQILERRMKAKEEGNKTEADSLKIVLNSTFGKFNEFYSKMRDPVSGTAICINGQLAILRLMDLCYSHGIGVLMANTDGIITKQNPQKIMDLWVEEMRMPLEVKKIKKYLIQNSNNHILAYDSGETKIKGAYFAFDKSVAKQNLYPIVNKAICEKFINGTPIEETILGEKNIHLFLSCYAKGWTIEEIKLAEKVEDVGEFCPNVSRYYLSKESKLTIFKKNAKSWIKVSGASGIKLLNKIITVDLPKDLDYNSYIEMAVNKWEKLDV